ncbi:MAG: hypothetical protein WA117_13120 [Verrucomicrobiia bacterium]
MAMTSLTPLWKRPMFWLVFLAVASVTSLFFYHWRIGYNSDSAMIGLMAKSILERGERPIFVWSVGYQGMLLEGYAVALCFKLFGINPWVLNIWNTICLWSVFILFYWCVKRCTDISTALLSVLLLAVSATSFYTLVMRTQPNYTETCFFGLVLIALSQVFVRRFYLKGAGSDRRTMLCALGFGLVGGFGAYTYGQIYYFFAAIGFQWLLIYVRDIRCAGREAYTGLRQHPMLRWGVWCFVVLFVFGVLCWMTDFHRVNLIGIRLRWRPLSLMGLSAVVFAVCAAHDVWVRHGNRIRELWREAIVVTAGFLAGYSPALVYVWIQHGTQVPRMGITETFEFFKNIKIALFFAPSFLNLSTGSVMGLASVVAVSFVLLSFIYLTCREAVRFTQGRSEANTILKLNPLVLLPWMVLPMFLVAKAVVDQCSARYLLVLIFYSAVAMSVVVLWLLRRGGALRILGVLFLVSFLSNNVISLGKALQTSQHAKFEGECVIPILKEFNLKYGYADYWHAYAVMFFTNEDFILEPIYSNYSPYYGPLVKAQRRVVYLDRDPPRFVPTVDGIVEIYGIPYRVINSRRSDGLVVYVIEKLVDGA